MQNTLKSFGFVGLVFFGWVSAASAAEVIARGGRIDPVFGTPADCNERIVTEIDSAKRSVRVRSYGLPDRSVLDAMTRAAKRGLSCEIIINADAAPNAAKTIPADIELYADRLYPVPLGSLHISLDRKTTIIGSLTTGLAADSREAAHIQIIQSLAGLTRQYDSRYARYRERAERITSGDKASSPVPAEQTRTSIDDKVILGRSTRTDLIRHIGEPASVTRAVDGTETWTYLLDAPAGVRQSENISFTVEGTAYNHTTTRTLPEMLARAAGSVDQKAAASPIAKSAASPRPTAPRGAETGSPDEPSHKDVIVYVTKTGEKYHRKDCQHVRDSGTTLPLADAKKRYSPCSRCKP